MAPAEEPRPVSARDRPLAVADLVRIAGRALEQAIGLVWVEGEVAQCQRPASGHLYLMLRDRAAVVPAVMWRTAAERLRFKVEAGMRLRVRGRMAIYERDGKLQLYVDFAEPAGIGAAALALEQLKQKLAGEGLFDAAKKKPLPLLPRRIGVVTSATGAAVRDIIRTVQRRFPVPILISDAAVQGPSAPAQIIHALRMVVRAGVDVVIVGRGGGSVTDLSAFNDESLVRLIAKCPVPVVSAVGHEIDLTLCDLVADRRASTPTAAAELVVPVLTDLAAALGKEERRLGRELEHRLRAARHDVDRAVEAAHRRVERQMAARRHQLAVLMRRLGEHHPRARLAARRAELAALEKRLGARAPGPRLDAGRAAVRAAEARLHTIARRRLDAGGRQLGALAGRLDALSPLRVLDRGYALATADGAILHDAAAVAPGATIDLRLARGGLRCTVDEVQPAPPASADPKGPP
jgi:exodeoxyribonuclease VII large subunit